MTDDTFLPDEFFGFNSEASDRSARRWTDVDDEFKQAMSNRDAGPRTEQPMPGHDGAGHPRSRFAFVPVGELELRPPEFLVEGLIESDTLAVVFGEPGSAKSFLAVDIACSVATGRDFHGRAVKQGPALYLAGEGHFGLARRFRAWEAARATNLTGTPLFKSTCAAQFLDSASAAEVTAAVAGVAAAHGPPSLIVVDTLARNFGPGDENSTAEMGRFVAAMDALRDQYPGCVVLIVHHSGHQEKERGRGSTALKAAADAEFVVVKDENRVELRCTKMKDSDAPPDIHFSLVDYVLNGDGSLKSAALIEKDNGGSISRKGKSQKPMSATNQRYWDGILDYFGGEGRTELKAPKRGMKAIPCADIDDVRDYCWRAKGVTENASTDRSQWRRALDELGSRQKIGTFERKIWLV
ncbi:AAA family ATPase [Rhizobium ruizarguesonis]